MSPSVQPGTTRSKTRSSPDPEVHGYEEREPRDFSGLPPSAIARAVGQEVLRQADARPYTTVVVAATAGYMLAVATPRWATGLLWTVGSRIVVSKLVSSLTP